MIQSWWRGAKASEEIRKIDATVESYVESVRIHLSWPWTLPSQRFALTVKHDGNDRGGEAAQRSLANAPPRFLRFAVSDRWQDTKKCTLQPIHNYFFHTVLCSGPMLGSPNVVIIRESILLRLVRVLLDLSHNRFYCELDGTRGALSHHTKGHDREKRSQNALTKSFWIDPQQGTRTCDPFSALFCETRSISSKGFTNKNQHPKP